MAATALIKFTQFIYSTVGEAFSGSAGTAVTVENANNADVQSWRIELLYVPQAPTPSAYTPTPGSPVVLAQSPGGSVPTASFIPDLDVYGCYRIRLTVYSDTNYAGSADVDIRNFAVPLPNRGLILPPYQRHPDPLPLQSKPDELNFSGGLFGWSGDNTPPLANMALYWADAGLLPVYTGTLPPPPGLAEGQMIYINELRQPYWWSGSEWYDFGNQPLPFLTRRVEPASYSQIVLPLNEAGPPWANRGVQQAAGTWSGTSSVIAHQSAFLDRGVQFQNSLDDGVLIGPTSSSLQGWTTTTITAWVYVSQTPTVEGTVIYKSGLTNPQRTISIGIDSTLRPNVYIEGYGTVVSATASSSALTLNRWHFLAATYDLEAINLYRDGVLVASAAYTTSLNWGTLSAEQNAPWLIGNNDLSGVSGARPFWGVIEEVQVLNTGWDATEVMNAYLKAYGLRRELHTPTIATSAGTASELWTPPSVAHPYDDEFNSITLDPSWSWRNATDLTNITPTVGGVNPYDFAGMTDPSSVPRYVANPATRPSWLLVQAPGNGKLFFAFKSVTIPTNFLMVARCKFSQQLSPQDNDSLVGISIMTDNAGPNHFDRIDLLLNETDSAKMTVQAHIIDGSVVGTTYETVDSHGLGQAFEYVALHKRGTQFACWAGTANGNWIYLGSFFDSKTYAYLAIMVQNTHATPAPYVVGVDFLRCYETDNFLL